MSGWVQPLARPALASCSSAQRRTGSSGGSRIAIARQIAISSDRDSLGSASAASGSCSLMVAGASSTVDRPVHACYRTDVQTARRSGPRRRRPRVRRSSGRPRPEGPKARGRAVEAWIRAYWEALPRERRAALEAEALDQAAPADRAAYEAAAAPPVRRMLQAGLRDAHLGLPVAGGQETSSRERLAKYCRFRPAYGSPRNPWNSWGSRAGPLRGFLARGSGQVGPSSLVRLAIPGAERPVFWGLSLPSGLNDRNCPVTTGTPGSAPGA